MLLLWKPPRRKCKKLDFLNSNYFSRKLISLCFSISCRQSDLKKNYQVQQRKTVNAFELLCGADDRNKSTRKLFQKIFYKMYCSILARDLFIRWPFVVVYNFCTIFWYKPPRASDAYVVKTDLTVTWRRTTKFFQICRSSEASRVG